MHKDLRPNAFGCKPLSLGNHPAQNDEGLPTDTKFVRTVLIRAARDITGFDPMKQRRHRWSLGLDSEVGEEATLTMELPKRHANFLAGSRFTPLDAEVGITPWQ